MRSTKHLFAIADDYLALIKRFPLVPIRTAAQLREAHAVIDELAIIDEAKLATGQVDYLDVLSGLVEKYEEANFPIGDPFADGVEALQYLIEQAGMSASDLGRLLGNRQLGSAILRRDRELSKGHIVKLAGYFKVSTDLFLTASRN